MKRYIVFAGSDYYPGGGWGDFRGDFDTLEEARALIKTLLDYDWQQIVDTFTKEEVE